MTARTQVGIVGAGPAGLLLGHLLDRAGIDNVILEKRSREHVEGRLRAGVLEQSTVELLRDLGVADRLDREAATRTGIELRFDGDSRRMPLADLTGRSMTVYGQRKIVQDLIAARLERGTSLVFSAADVAVCDIDRRPTVTYSLDGRCIELRCDVVAGCDGFHGVCRTCIPAGAIHAHERDFGSTWLGLLAETPPAYAEVVYATSPGGFALGSWRTPEVSRLYVECPPADTVDDWPDERVWDELACRLATEGFALRPGPTIEKDVTSVRAFVAEPMRVGQLFLVGDAAHIFPPMGAKGLNVAAADAATLAEALERCYAGDARALDGYSTRCLRRAWRVQQFSAQMMAMLHLPRGRCPADAGYDRRLQRSWFDWVTTQEAGMRDFAENYVGVPF
jgi:p-hydroxybenzoate 3-monooxygenase